MDRRIFLSFLAAVSVLAAVVFMALMAAPFAKSAAWALVIGVATKPYHVRLTRRLRTRPALSAAIMVFGVFACIVVPLAFALISAASNAEDWSAEVSRLASSITTATLPDFLSHGVPGKIAASVGRFGIDLKSSAVDVAGAVGKSVGEKATAAVANVFGFVATMGLSVFILFFVYRDGESVLETAVNRFAGDKELARRRLSAVRSTVTAVVVGTLLTCAVQGTLAGVGYWLTGMPAPVFFGAMTAVAALIPIVGTAVIWIPMVIFAAVTTTWGNAAFLLGFCVVFVGLSDQVVRPLAIGATEDIPVLAVVLGAIGGVSLLGLVGLVLGPVSFAVLVSVWKSVTGTQARNDADISDP